VKLLFDENISPQLIDCFPIFILTRLMFTNVDWVVPMHRNLGVRQGQRLHHSVQRLRLRGAQRSVWLSTKGYLASREQLHHGGNRKSSTQDLSDGRKIIQQDNETWLILEHRPSRK
jgi:hypothetical protein